MNAKRKKIEKKPVVKLQPKKRIEKKVVVETATKKRPKQEPKPEDKYVRIATDSKPEAFRQIGERVQAGEIKWAYYASDGNKGYHHYIVL